MGSKKSGGLRKHGRNKIKCERYRREQRREKNKIRRILRSNGLQAARAYAARYGLQAYLDRLLR